MQKEERVEKLVNEIAELKLSKRVAKLLYMQNDFLLVGTSMGLVTGLYFGKLRSTVSSRTHTRTLIEIFNE